MALTLCYLGLKEEAVSTLLKSRVKLVRLQTKVSARDTNRA